MPPIRDSMVDTKVTPGAKGGGRATNTWPVDVKVKQKTVKRKNRTGRKVSTLASLVSLGLIGAIIALLG